MRSNILFLLLALSPVWLVTTTLGNENNPYIFRGLTVGQSTQRDVLSSRELGTPIIAIPSAENVLSYYYRIPGFRQGDYNVVVTVRNEIVHSIDVFLRQGTSARDSARAFNLGSPSLVDPRSPAASLGSYVTPTWRPVHYDAGAAVLYLDDRVPGGQTATLVRFYAPDRGNRYRSGDYRSQSSAAQPYNPAPQPKQYFQKRSTSQSNSRNTARFGPQRQDEITIFIGGNYRDKSFRFTSGQSIPNLNSIPGGPGRLDNELSSIRVSGDLSVILFQDRNFEGDSVHIYESIPSLNSILTTEGNRLRWNDEISSLKVIDNTNPRASSNSGPEKAGTLYAAGNFKEKSLQLYAGQDIPDLRQHGLDNHASSITVDPDYEIQLFEYANYQGESITVTGNHPSLRNLQNSLSFNHWNDRVSSLKVIQKQ